ncbi:MAG: ABC transporter ATP-binding protein [Pseudomonadota bacterium]
MAQARKAETAKDRAETPAIAFDSVEFAWPGSASFRIEIENLAIARGDRVALLGPSGCGKSTFLSLLCGVVTPDAGDVTVLGQSLGALGGPARDRFRGDHIGVIFQLFNLLPYATVTQNILLPLTFAPERRRRVDDPAIEATQLLSALGLETALADAPARDLSVGQQQRVAVARAVIGSPEIIAADEPTSALDADRRDHFLDLLFAKAEETRTTVILVTHDPSVAARFDRQIALSDVARVSRDDAGGTL